MSIAPTAHPDQVEPLNGNPAGDAGFPGGVQLSTASLTVTGLASVEPLNGNPAGDAGFPGGVQLSMASLTVTGLASPQVDEDEMAPSMPRKGPSLNVKLKKFVMLI